jgi:hypothetical protein
MDSIYGVAAAIRSRLCTATNVRSLVATSNIRISYGVEPTSYPAIRIRIAGATGDSLEGFFSGDLYLNIYTANDAPMGHLATIYNAVRGQIHDRASSLRTSTIGFARIKEQYVDYPIYDPDTGKYFLSSRFRLVGQNRTR